MSKISLTYPESGLTVNLSILNQTTEVEDFSGVANEIGSSKNYIFSFTEVTGTDYTYIATVSGYDNISGAIFYETSGGGGGGLTTEEHNKLFSLENSSGGFVRTVGLDPQDKKYIRETHEKVMVLENTIVPDYTEKLNEIDSHNSLVKEEIINTIKEVETEICSDIIRKTKEIKEDNIATRNLVRQKTKKLDENVSKLADRQDKTDKMIEGEADEIEESLEKIYKEEGDAIEKELEDQYKKEAQDIENELNS